jgi:bacillopeptidase F
MDQGSQATFTFTGTAVQWIGYRDPWSGIAQVYLDGVLKGTIDTYSASTQAQAVVYSLNGLANVSHTLTLVVTGTRNASSAGTWVWLDAFDVSVPSTTGSTSSTPIRIEQTAPALSYSGGSWSTNTSANSSGGSAALSMDAKARATVAFSGTAVKWIGYRDQWSGKARVYVDGVLKATVDTYASAAQSQALLYTATGLASGAHTLAIEVAGTRSAASRANWVWVDAFEITP